MTSLCSWIHIISINKRESNVHPLEQNCTRVCIRNRRFETRNNITVIGKWNLCKRECLMNRCNCKVDRISQLPEPIIHHILSFLHTEDAVCTSILSKRWRGMWCTFPVFDFQLDEYSYLAKHGIKDCEAEASKDEFLSFVEESLNRRLLHKFSIHKFRMSMSFSNLEHLTPWMDRWLAIIIGRNVKELELEVPRHETNGLYSVPPFVLGAKSITVLKLSRCDLHLTLAAGISKFSQLRELHLGKMHINQWMIQTFTSSCPLIEILELSLCIGLDCLCLPSSLLQLNKVVLRNCHWLKTVQIEVPNLVDYIFQKSSDIAWKISMFACGKSRDYFFKNSSDITSKINMVACGKSLRKLSLLIDTLTEEEFQSLMSVTPNVEFMELSYLKRFSRLKISSQKLKRLVLKDCKKSLVTEIDTPNLVSVEHTCYRRYLCINYINTSHLREVYLESELASHHIGWFTKLKDFLTSFPYSENFRAVVVCSKNVSIHDKLREFFLPPLYNLKDLNPQIIISSRAFTEVLNRIFYACHHDTLSLISMCSCSKDLELLYHTIVEQEENSERYGGRRRNWRHFLGGFEIENLEGTKEKRTSPWRDFLKSYSSVPYQVVALRLEWKCLNIEWKVSRVMF
ncbi:F-box/LRR-repeat protein At5g02910-like isoform X2 [Rhododendron vialii]|uniref:F-box/LRR-repeat protein At5g02910-like isoform X2 n=1 Tax=Rhododendron vialii TaxID=182163 RepID=UPI00265FFEF0|nr:F-box/LRR-repeat protein At5g02910-like isoform X2 [Rhododendron vialii]